MLSGRNRIYLIAVAVLGVCPWTLIEAGEENRKEGSAASVNAGNSPTPSDWITDKLSLYMDVQYYDWESDRSASGHQTVVPLTATYRIGPAEFGLRTAWIESVNNTPNRRGKVSTLSDTALSVAYNQLLQDGWSLRYNLDYNAPTGKATLSGSQKNAIMDGNLVQQTRFGEGHNVTPGVVVIKAINPNTALGAGVSYTLRGPYDPNGDVSNDRLNPGDEAHLTLQGQYATQDFMLIGGAIYTWSGTSTVDGRDYFQKGERFDLNLTGIFALPYAQTLTAGARYTTQRPDSYANRINGNFEQESHNINGDSIYLFLEYAKKWEVRHTFKVMGDWLKVNANSYDQFNDLYNGGRTKYSLGLGYSYQLTPKNLFSIALRNFKMDDKATPVTKTDTEYDGWSVLANTSINF